MADIPTIAVAMALLNGAATKANQAAAAATQAAEDANEAKEQAEQAAEDANQAAAGYAGLANDVEIDRIASNYAYTMAQAEFRDVQGRLATTEAQLAALTS